MPIDVTLTFKDKDELYAFLALQDALRRDMHNQGLSANADAVERLVTVPCREALRKAISEGK